MKNKKLLRKLALIISIVTILTCLVSCGEDEKGEFIPPPFDEGAVVGIPEIGDPESIGYGEIDAQAYKLSICGKVVLDGDKADIYLTNPETNNVWFKVRVLDEKGNRLGETGLVRPGEYVKSITFTKVPKKGDTITLKIMGYQPDTYYSAGAANLKTVVS